MQKIKERRNNLKKMERDKNTMISQLLENPRSKKRGRPRKYNSEEEKKTARFIANTSWRKRDQIKRELQLDYARGCHKLLTKLSAEDMDIATILEEFEELKIECETQLSTTMSS